MLGLRHHAQHQQMEEDRVRQFIASQGAMSETAVSLANKLRVSKNASRHVLEVLAKQDLLAVRSFERGIEPVYFSYRQRENWTPGVRPKAAL